MVPKFAKKITEIKPEKHWLTRFLRKHSDELISRYTTGMESSRKRADSAYKYAL
jgi:hypothetical protein